MSGPPLCPDIDCTVPGCREYYDSLAHYDRLRAEAKALVARMIAAQTHAVAASPER